MLGRQDYARFRFGIGADFSKGHQVDYVLGNWGSGEMGKWTNAWTNRPN